MPKGIYERTKRPVADRFWVKVDKSGGCWEWTAGKNAGGYGQIGFDGKMRAAHRISWIMENGIIPKGMLICHVCDNRACVNPAHLFLGTHKDNTQDAVKKGRMANGESSGLSRLTEKQVLSIRREYAEGKTQLELARKYNVSRITIHKIVTRKTWKHI